MDKIYVVSYCHHLGLINLHAFTNEDKAESYAINYIYNRATREDLESRIERDEFDRYKEFSLYTTQYGNVTVRVEAVRLN